MSDIVDGAGEREPHHERSERMKKQVRVFHNVARDEQGRRSNFDGYQAGRPMVEVFRTEMEGNGILERVFHLLNVGDDPTFGTPDPIAVEYRKRGNRSLSVGDVVAIDGKFYACASSGWDEITEPVNISTDSVAGSTSIK